jgi:hypothetical protein
MRTLYFYFFNKYNQVVLEKSSMKIIKYLSPLNDSKGVGPQTSKWINSKGLELLQLEGLNDNLVCFPNLHTSQLLQSKILK